MHPIQHDSLTPILIEIENIVNMNGFVTQNMSGVDHSSNNLDYSVSNNKDSVDFRIYRSCPVEADGNTNDYTSCTVN